MSPKPVQYTRSTMSSLCVVVTRKNVHGIQHANKKRRDEGEGINREQQESGEHRDKASTLKKSNNLGFKGACYDSLSHQSVCKSTKASAISKCSRQFMKQSPNRNFKKSKDKILCTKREYKKPYGGGKLELKRGRP